MDVLVLVLEWVGEVDKCMVQFATVYSISPGHHIYDLAKCDTPGCVSCN